MNIIHFEPGTDIKISISGAVSQKNSATQICYLKCSREKELREASRNPLPECCSLSQIIRHQVNQDQDTDLDTQKC